MNIPLVDTPSSLMLSSNRYFHRDQVELALHNMLTFMKLKVNTKLPWQVAESSLFKIKILMCFMCGDPYNMTLPLAPLLNHQSCLISKHHQQTVNLEVYLDENKRKVSVSCCSYHEANKTVTSLFHGCILVYSVRRLASLSNLKAFASKTRVMPIKLLAVLEGGSQGNIIHNNILSNSSNVITHHLLNEGKLFAESINASFMTTSPNFQQQIGSYTPFFKECWDQRRTTEFMYTSSSSSSSPLMQQQANKHKRHSSVSEKMKHRPPAALPRRIISNINNTNNNSFNNIINKIINNGTHVLNSNSLDVRSNDSSSSADDSDPSCLYHMSTETDADRGMSFTSHLHSPNPVFASLPQDDLYSEINTLDTDQLIQPTRSLHHRHKREKSSNCTELENHATVAVNGFRQEFADHVYYNADVSLLQENVRYCNSTIYMNLCDKNHSFKHNEQKNRLHNLNNQHNRQCQPRYQFRKSNSMKLALDEDDGGNIFCSLSVNV
ncbi:hypothetical protein HELRODRAFT_173859 [Helobdella robusta]|uniref:PG2 pseudoGTPase domain-containing protein n=1 Tax=Helobdella robusta TaxID=6412 RepID=T1F7B4_HELRO|nr:hypothetical protein HELRODRAFT_173859 [Helobdella robusta]ESO03012.1 hypothetical protein HELRODRAFT_173859 [Helobdella robusta]